MTNSKDYRRSTRYMLSRPIRSKGMIPLFTCMKVYRRVDIVDVEGLGAAEGTTGIYAGQVRPKLRRLPAFVDGKDDLDSWLLRFERFANTSGWLKENWCTSLSALLTGRALEDFVPRKNHCTTRRQILPSPYRGGEGV